jgi:hypothetical protein
MTFRYFTSYYIAVQNSFAHYSHIDQVDAYKLHASGAMNVHCGTLLPIAGCASGMEQVNSQPNIGRIPIYEEQIELKIVLERKVEISRQRFCFFPGSAHEGII